MWLLADPKIEIKTIERAFLDYSDESVRDEDFPLFICNIFSSNSTSHF
jgi:hypothetical protein